MKSIGIGLAVLMGCLAAPAFAQAPGTPIANANAAGIGQLSWLTGHWRLESPQAGGRIRWTEEHWTDAQGGMMLGVGRSGTMSEPSRSFEFLRIGLNADRRLAYFAQPNGGPAVRFDLVEAGPTSATFENRAHDYPQRITYRREGDDLHAAISLADGSRTMRWTYRRQRHEVDW